MSRGWQGSNRRQELPKDWVPKIRPAVRRRAGGRCEGPTDPETGVRPPDVPRCEQAGTDADHISDPHDHGMHNLQWLCGACHQAKTTVEARAGYRAWVNRAKRPKERHPGLL